MSYSVKEIYYTLQGEGAHTGRPAVFLRFAGCNLWSGLERDRTSAVCQFCDTDFVGTDGPGGGKFASPGDLADAVAATWQSTATTNGTPPFVVCTGGEPLLQLDEPLVQALHRRGFQVAIETNGTRPAPSGIDWICCSPKIGAPLVLERGDELKFVYPQGEADPAQFVHLNFEHFFIQPMDGPDREKNTALAVQYCRAHPKWRLSLQTHKILGIR
jgi:7-carboxy-7-deazaguanine synthase (Cx14CxxC type)